MLEILVSLVFSHASGCQQRKLLSWSESVNLKQVSPHGLPWISTGLCKCKVRSTTARPCSIVRALKVSRGLFQRVKSISRKDWTGLRVYNCDAHERGSGFEARPGASDTSPYTPPHFLGYSSRGVRQHLFHQTEHPRTRRTILNAWSATRMRDLSHAGFRRVIY